MTMLTVREVAERIKLSPSAVYLLVERKQIAHHRLGGQRGAIRISEQDLETYLAICRVETQHETRPTVSRRPRLYLKDLNRTK